MRVTSSRAFDEWKLQTLLRTESTILPTLVVGRETCDVVVKLEGNSLGKALPWKVARTHSARSFPFGNPTSDVMKVRAKNSPRCTERSTYQTAES
jgi:hypothetical protein